MEGDFDPKADEAFAYLSARTLERRRRRARLASICIGLSLVAFFILIATAEGVAR